MMRAVPLNLRAGDHVETDFDGRKTVHVVVARKLTPNTQSGVSYRISPNPRKASVDAWLDAAWLSRATGYANEVEGEP
jgi:hypothetical protein